MNKLILGFIFLILAVSVNAQTAPIKKKSYVDEQKILNVEASTPRAGYISAPYRKTDGIWYEKTEPPLGIFDDFEKFDDKDKALEAYHKLDGAYKVLMEYAGEEGDTLLEYSRGDDK